MTQSMKKALEILKDHGRMTRVRIGYTDWLPIGENPVWDENRYYRNVCKNKTCVQSASIGRLIDAGWAEYEDKTKMRVRFIDRDAPIREAKELIVLLAIELEQFAGHRNEHPESDAIIRKADAFLKKHGGKK